MMRILYTFAILLSSSAVMAQLTLSQSNMPSSNTSYLYEITTALDSEDFSLTGASYAWDFSSAVGLGLDTVINVTVTSTPFAYQLFFNNVFQYPNHVADLAIEGMSLSAGGQVTIEDRFDYYKKNSDSYEIVGYGAEINSIPASVRYDTIDQVYPLPMTYNTTDSTRAFYLTTVPSLGTYGQSIQRRVLVDGYGSLVTPIDTYSDVLRVKTILYQRDTIYSDQFMFGTAFNRPVETIYEWWDNVNNTPLMKVNINGGQVTNAQYFLTSGVSIEENELASIELVPNGNFGEFNMVNESGSGVKEIYVFDVAGRRVNAKINDTKITISGTSSQIVVISLKLNNGKIWSKKTMLK